MYWIEFKFITFTSVQIYLFFKRQIGPYTLLLATCLGEENLRIQTSLERIRLRYATLPKTHCCCYYYISSICDDPMILMGYMTLDYELKRELLEYFIQNYILHWEKVRTKFRISKYLIFRIQVTKKLVKSVHLVMLWSQVY